MVIFRSWEQADPTPGLQGQQEEEESANYNRGPGPVWWQMLWHLGLAGP